MTGPKNETAKFRYEALCIQNWGVYVNTFLELLFRSEAS